MAYYDKIAAKWHKITGYKGGSFKELILNERIISKVGMVDSKSILEIGIGNGYFMPMLLRKKSGQVPKTIFLTDISKKNLEIARKNFKVRNAIYQRLDLYDKFIVSDNSMDLVLSTMVFNEVNKVGLENGFREMKRVLKNGGQFVISVLHPEFIEKQMERGVVKNNMMVSKDGMKIPSFERKLDQYLDLLELLELEFEMEAVFGNKKLFNMKPKLKEIAETPIALIIYGNNSVV